MSDEAKFYNRLVAYAQLGESKSRLHATGAPKHMQIPVEDLVLGMKHASAAMMRAEQTADKLERIRALCTSSESNYEVFANDILDVLNE